MPKKTAAAATPAPAPAAAALACGNAACGKALAPPLLQCSKCKGEAYCCKACQVGDSPLLRTAPYASARSPAPAPFPPACTPPGCRVEGRAQAQVRRAGTRRGGGEAEERRAGGGHARRSTRGRASAGA